MKKTAIALLMLSAAMIAGSCQKDNNPDKMKSTANLPVGALPGEFSVDANDKKVHFSKGNLRYTVGNPGTWSFFDKQYEYGPSDYYSGHNTGISLFTWGYDATKSIIPDGAATDNVSRTSGDLEQSEDWGYVFGGESSVWRTLTTAEWQYLLSYDSYDNDVRRGKYKCFVTVCDVDNCVVLLPDVWDEDVISLTNFASQTTYNNDPTSPSTPTWDQMQAAGAVCLPAAGFRHSSKIYYADWTGYYWSSSAENEEEAYYVNFLGNAIVPDIYTDRNDGYSVHLITECQDSVNF